MSDKTLTDLLPELRRPFTVAAVKIKPQVVTKDQTKGLVTFYIDSRLLVERLNTVVGAAGWEDTYRLLTEGEFIVRFGLPVECSLTVMGVTKTDVGQLVPGEMDEKAWKSAYSDAFKRAGVKFGVGAYLYNLPQVWAETRIGGNGKAQGFSDVGRRNALAAYARWLESGLNTYGEPLDHGDIAADDIHHDDDTPDTTRLHAAIDAVNAAGQRLLPEAVNRAALKYYGKPVAQLEQAQVDALADRLEKHAAGIRAAQGSGGDPNGTSPATVEPAAPDAPVAVNTTQSSTPGDAVVFSPPDTGSAGDTSGDGESGTEAAGSPADNTPFKAPTVPRGAKRKAAAA